ncbi:hypothetical protein F5Y00DRAFT_105168 [Daldinia vernicosa]|uniref:uncharacterized protein n=1 Tax=Daldinia vernicosa TaxID=114800 RepID=UPI0020075A10|nr:uncharacterized protein F5Y00DRAFT_105168 [Daldinia vernicosa]KAI0853613.1 hypothetical protein F5Y00DRAFT_105168 [Daldinia vernicosa]
MSRMSSCNRYLTATPFLIFATNESRMRGVNRLRIFLVRQVHTYLGTYQLIPSCLLFVPSYLLFVPLLLVFVFASRLLPLLLIDKTCLIYRVYSSTHV